MSRSLAGRAVAITGAARGIGKAIATEFVARGARVYLGDLDGDLAAKAAAELGGAGFALDVRSRASFAGFLDAVRADAGRVDVLVNNAGIMPLGHFVDEPDETTDAVLDVNVRGIALGMKLALPEMIARGDGHVINVASLLGRVPAAGAATYSASKFAIVGLSQSVRDEIAGTGVAITAVLPTAVRTELIAGMKQGGVMPTVDPEDVARAVVRACARRPAIVTVPSWLGAVDLWSALVPDRLMEQLRRRATAPRVFGLDAKERARYDERVHRIEGKSHDRD